jgi:hypothetical protein
VGSAVIRRIEETIKNNTSSENSLDAIEQFPADLMKGVSLGEIEWSGRAFFD